MVIVAREALSLRQGQGARHLLAKQKRAVAAAFSYGLFIYNKILLPSYHHMFLDYSFTTGSILPHFRSSRLYKADKMARFICQAE